MQYPTDAHEEQTWGWKTKAAINRGINMKTGTRYACRSRSPLGFYHQVSLFYNLTPSLNGFLLTNITESRWYGQQWKVPKHSLHWEFLLCQMCKIERKLCVWPLIFKCKGHPPESLSNAFVWNIPSKRRLLAVHIIAAFLPLHANSGEDISPVTPR